MSSGPIINGKFLSVPVTGVHRVAGELANAMADLAAERGSGETQVWLPYDGAERAQAIRLPCRVVGPLRGIFWEQVSLPFAARGRLILNLCNIAPVAATNAVTMIHDAQVYLTPKSYSRGFATWYRLVQPLIGKRHRHLLTVSEYSKKQLVEIGLASADRISVVHNGVDHIVAVGPDPAILARLALRRRGFVVALASTQPHKNIRLLLRAFADPALAGLKLVLIGSGDPAAFGPELAVRDNIIFAGRVTDGELRALYESALCLAFPSLTEGFGLPPLEAMRVGCPAIVAPCGALPEVCGDAATYVDPSAPGKWVAALLDLAAHEDAWLQQSRNGIVHASHYSWRRAAERLLEILDGLGATHGSTAPHLAPVTA